MESFAWLVVPVQVDTDSIWFELSRVAHEVMAFALQQYNIEELVTLGEVASGLSPTTSLRGEIRAFFLTLVGMQQ